MNKYDILSETSKVVGLTNKTVSDFIDVIGDCICSAILDSKIKGEQFAVLDLGISTISLDLVNGQWKSIPNKNFKQKCSDILKDGSVDPISSRLLEDIQKKFAKVLEEVK